MTKRNTYSIVCLLLVAFVLLGTAVFPLVDLNAAAASEPSGKSLESPLTVSGETVPKFRPTSETESDMEAKRESVEEKRDSLLFTVLAWILIVLLFAAGLLFIFFPDVATELNFFWHNLLNVWTGWDTTTWDFRYHRVESTGTPGIFDYVIGAIFVICSLSSAAIMLF